MRQRPGIGFLTGGLVLASLATSAAAMDVLGIAITSGPFRENGGLPDYRLTFNVEGTQIIGGRVLKPGVPPTELCLLQFSGPGLLGEDTWACELEGFSSPIHVFELLGVQGGA